MEPFKVLNTAYDTSLDREYWLKAVVEEYQRAFPDLRQRFGFMYRTNESGEFEMVSGPINVDDVPEEQINGVLMQFNSMNSPQVRNLFNEITCASLSQRAGELGADHLLSAPASFGIHDVVGVSSGNFGGNGFLFASFMDERTRVNAHARRRWTMVAAHVAAIARLRLNVSNEKFLEVAEWIYDTKRKRTEHLTLSKRDDNALHQGVENRDRHRSGTFADLARWKALTEGRWTLLDVVESGREYVVAVRNDPPARERLSLTKRQEQILWFLLQGHSQTLIGYELGLSPATVSDAVADLRVRFRVRSTPELVAKIRAASGLESESMDALTDVEKSVASMAARGMSDAEIAANRGKSKKTISNQLYRIYRKLGVNSRQELVSRYDAG